MLIDLELFRQDVLVSSKPTLRLSVIDISPEAPQRTLVFIHGFGGRATQWQYQLNEFSTHNRVIAMDLRGHGRSDRPRSPYRMQEIQADLLALFDVLGINEKIVLVAHSFGGALATEFALAHPERVERLVLIASAGEFKLNPLYRLALRLPTPLLASLSGPTRKWLGAPPQVLQSWYRDNMVGWSGLSRFRNLTVPTLVIRGHLDIVLEKPIFEEVARAIPGAEEVDVGASGHMVMLERRAAVNRAISRFLDVDRRSWSAREARSPRFVSAAQTAAERPWLPRYDEGIPPTIAIPRIPVDALLRSAARRYASRPAILFEGSQMTYRNLNQQVNRFAAALERLGLENGERVMLILPNLPQLVIAFYAVLRAGGVAVFSMPSTEPSELAHQLQETGARILITLPQLDTLLEYLRQHSAQQPGWSLEHIILAHPDEYLPAYKRLLWRARQPRTQSAPVGSVKLHDFRPLVESAPVQSTWLPPLPRDLAVIQYTGGTTARPKGVMLSHRNLVANAVQTRHWIPDAREGRECFLCVLPFSHSYGLTAALNVPVTLGASLILKARFEVRDVLRTIARQHPTIFPGVPQMYVAINDFPGVRRYGIQSIKACISGAAPLPVEVQEAFEKLTRGRLVEGYGLTEAGPVTHANPLNGLRKVGSIGVPLPSTEARIIDLRRGQETVAVGQIGELAVRGPQVMLGYWGNPISTSRVLTPDGWLLTGDAAQMDADGYFHIIARKADMWYPNKPGEPAFPRDVEEVLFEIPQVKEAAVVAIAGKPVAFVIGKEDRPASSTLIAYCERRLPPELVPRLVIFVDDFPRTFIGKVLRRELARRFEESRQHHV